VSLPLCRAAQAAAVARLLALGELRGVPVLERIRNDVANDIDAALNSLGVCLYVFPALPIAINPELPGPWVDQLEVRVRVFEVPELNTTGLPNAYEIVEYVLAGLHHHCPRLVDQAENPFVARTTPVADVSDDEATIFDVTFTVAAGIQLRAGDPATAIL